MILRRLTGWSLIATGAIVAVHTIVEPLYHVTTETEPFSPLWYLLDALMAIAIAVGVVFVGARKVRLDTDADLKEFLTVNTQFYGLLFIGILFYWNWFVTLSPGYTTPGSDTVALVWMLIDGALPLLLAAIGVHLARQPGG
ncbi:MAG: hypothetical protein OXC99_08825, partial [Chloroflexi bacterium]|nr:hypothetical protein [Chloroflexota bacterium]